MDNATDANKAEVSTQGVTAKAKPDAEKDSTSIMPQSETYTVPTAGQTIMNAGNSSVTINGQPLTDGMTVNYGDKFDIKVDFDVDNSISITPGTTFEYALPGNLKYTDTSGNAAMGDLKEVGSGNAVGTWEVKGNNTTGYKLVMTYTQAMGSDVEADVQFNASITEESMGNPDGGDKTFDFPGIASAQIDVKSEATVKTSKRVSQENGAPYNEYSYVIDVKATGKNDNVTLNDTMGSYLSLKDGGITVYTDYACTIPYTGPVTNTGNTAASTAFTTTISHMENETLYVKYTAVVDPKAQFEPNKGDGKLTNSVTYKSDQDEEEEPTGNTLWNVTSNWTNTKSGTADENGNITWTVLVGTKDGTDIGGTVVKDIPDVGLADPTQAIKFEASNDGGGSWAPVTGTALDWNTLKGSGYTFPAGSTSYYRITYTTKATAASIGDKTYNNKFTVDPFGDTGITQTITTPGVVLSGGHPLSKICETPNNSSATTLSWQIALNPATDLTNAWVSDKANSYGQNLVWGTDGDAIAITEEDGSPYTGSVTRELNNGVFKITFNETIAADTKLFINYQTKVDTALGSDLWISNKAEMGSDQGGDSTPSVTHHFLGLKLDKSGTPQKENGVFTGVIGWNLYVTGTTECDPSKITVVDTLPENMAYGNSVVAKMTNWPNTELSGVMAAESSDKKVVTFTFTGEAADYLKTGGQMTISYNTKVIDFTPLLDGTTSYTNSVALENDGTEEINKQTTVYTDKVLTTRKYVTYNAQTAPLANYRVIINPNAYDLVAESDTITVNDVAGEALEFKMGTLKINGVAATASQYRYDQESHTLTITIPDSTSVTLEYSCMVLPAVGSQLDASNAYNDVNLSAVTHNQGTTHNVLNAVVVDAAGSTSSTGHTLNVYKYVDDNTALALPGAMFRLDALTFTRDGNVYTPTDSTLTKGGLTTFDNGYTQTVSGLRSDTIYRLTETVTPQGYDQAPTRYIVFSDDSAWDGATMADGSSIERKTEYAAHEFVSDKTTLTSFTCAKMWSDGDNAFGLRPASVEFQLCKTVNGTTSDVPGATATLEPDNPYDPAWLYTFENLPAFENGLPITYSVRETSVDPHYTATKLDTPTTTILNTINLHDVSFSKVDFNTDNFLPGAEIKLLDSNNVELAKITTDDESSFTFHLASGTYTLSESKAPSGYNAAEDIVFTVDDEGNVTVKGAQTSQIVMRDTPTTTDVPCYKIWSDDNNSSGYRPTSVEVQLMKSVGGAAAVEVPGKTATVTGASTVNTWGYSFNDLPAYEDGKKIVYTVKETSSDSHYTPSYSADRLTVTNAIIPETLDLDVSKVWNDADDQDGIRPSSVTVRLEKKVGNATFIDAGDAYQKVLEDGNNWRASWTNLNNRENGEYVTWRTVEASVAGYTTSYDNSAIKNGKVTNTITNVHTPETVSVRAQKIWDDDGNVLGYRPSSVSFVLKKTVDGTTEEVTGKTATLSAADAADANTWFTTFTNLPKYEDGKLITYEVAEDDLSDSSPYSEPAYSDDRLTVTNTLETSEIEIYKYDAATRGVVGIEKLLEGASLQISDKESMRTLYSWTSGSAPETINLPDGEYVLSEIQAPTGYVVADPITFFVLGGMVFNEEGETDWDNSVRMDDAPIVTSVLATKVWNDAANAGSTRVPITFYLEATADDGLNWYKVSLFNPNVTSEFTFDPVDYPSLNSWECQFDDLPSYANGVELTYRVREELPSSFSDVYSTSYSNDGLTTINTVNSQVNVEKVWDDADDQDGKRTNSVEIQLQKKVGDGEFTDAGDTYKKTLSADNDWKAAWTGLPSREGDDTVTWRVKEVTTISGYTTTYADSSTIPWLINATITNVHAPEVVDIDATKIWDDNDNAESTRPNTIEFQLTKTLNGVTSDVAGKTATLSDTDRVDGSTWKTTFSSLPKYENGEEIAYGVRETTIVANYEVPGYSDDNLTVTNKLIEKPPTPDTPGTPGTPDTPQTSDTPGKPSYSSATSRTSDATPIDAAVAITGLSLALLLMTLVRKRRLES